MLLLLVALAGCGKGGQGASRVAACEQAATLDKQMTADREAARTSIGSPGEQAGPDEVARRSQELNAKLAADGRRLEELRAKCLGATP
jgi:hypothetical protein